jgi:hypothetical protein
MKTEKTVGDILLNEWDPIGVKTNPNAKAEYNTYALKITGMLYAKADEAEIAEYLNEVVTKDFGLKSDREITAAVSKKLASLKLSENYKK